MNVAIQLQEPNRVMESFQTRFITIYTSPTSAAVPDIISCMMNEESYVVLSRYSTKYKDRLRLIGSLEANWDGYGAVALSDVVMNNTRKFLSVIQDKGFDPFLDEDNIVPTPYGTIDIDFETSKGLVSVEIGDSEIGFFTELNEEEDCSSEGIVTDFIDIPEVVINNISKLI